MSLLYTSIFQGNEYSLTESSFIESFISESSANKGLGDEEFCSCMFRSQRNQGRMIRQQGLSRSRLGSVCLGMVKEFGWFIKVTLIKFPVKQ